MKSIFASKDARQLQRQMNAIYPTSHHYHTRSYAQRQHLSYLKNLTGYRYPPRCSMRWSQHYFPHLPSQV